MRKDLNETLHCSLDAAGYAAHSADYLRKRGIHAVDGPTAEHIHRIGEWIKGNGRTGLMLMGSVGNGKTTLGRMTMSYLWLALKGKYDMMGLSDTARVAESELAVTSAQDITLKAMSDYPGTITALTDMKCLMIDDLGNEPRDINVYGNVMTPLLDIMERIYARDHALIITTNLDLRGIREKYGERVYDRLKETMHIVTFTNPSYRK